MLDQWFVFFVTEYVPDMWASLVAQLVKNPHAVQGTPFDTWVGKVPWRRERLPTPVFLGFPGSSAGKEPANAGDLRLIPGSGRSPGEGKGYPLQYSGLENVMDREAWQATVHGVEKESDTTEATWTDSLLYSEVSQKEKNKYHILTLIRGKD